MASPGNQMLLKQHEPALSTAVISSSQKCFTKNTISFWFHVVISEVTRPPVRLMAGW